MKFSLPRIIIIIIALFFALTLFGGSAVWTMLGFSDDLRIDGRAVSVRSDVPDLGEGWGAYGGDKGGNRFSNIDLLNKGNVSNLETAWIFKTGAFDGKEHLKGRAAFETTPILIEDSLVFCTQFNQVIAVHPRTGEEKWRYDPEIPTDGQPANQFTCRGVSYWQDDLAATDDVCKSRLFMGTVDARLIALDAKSGVPCQAFGHQGAVTIEPDIALRWPGELQITSAPAIIADIVVTGSAIGDNLRTEAPIGTVHAFDARTGEMKWRFNPIPRDVDDPARATWAGDSADNTGHANVWSSIAVDEKRGMIFLPTSSASPDYYGGNRIGDNRYANSVVALNGLTGEMVWNFQTVHHDVWDYDLPAQPGLYQVSRDGELHDIVAQVTKTGLVFVLDRDTGQPFLPIEERAVPQNAVVGEVLSPTQPFPVNTPPIVPNELDPKDAFGVTFWDKRQCAAQIRALRREGLFTPPSLQGTLSYPFVGGGANWGSSAFDPHRNLLVINMNNIASFMRLHPETETQEEAQSIVDGAEFAPMEGAPYSMTRAPLLSMLGLPCSPPPWGVLAGIDLDSGEIVWRRKIGTTKDLAPGGLAFDFGVPAFGGPITTAGGLIFIGATMDDYLRAFDVETGKELWKGRLPAGGQATPMTYEWQGRQYVVIAAGGHSSSGTKIGDSVVAFALPE
jgi:quinoprotein glucose dehydrogenase